MAAGEAEAILKIQEANAEGIKKLNEAGASKEVLILKSYEAMAKIANGQATKLIIPSDIQNAVALSSVIKEAFTDK